MPDAGSLVSISGLDDLAAAIAELRAATEAEQVEDLLMEAAEQTVVPDANGRAPAGLRGHIGAVRRKAHGRRAAEVGVGGLKGGGELAHLFEFGTGPRISKTGHATGQMPARPFVRPAYRGNRDRLIAYIADKMGKRLEQVRVSGRKAVKGARRG